MASTLTLNVLTTVLFCCCCNAYINNFRFKHSNVFKGDVIPFKAIISGTYYLDYLGTPELTYIEGTPQRNAVKTTSLKNDKLPVVCTGDTADMIVKQDGAAHKNLTIKLTKLAKEVLGNNATRVVELMKSWGPFIPIMSKYNCQPLNLEVSGDHGYTFKYMATFKEYKPIIFMDAMGMGMFNYKRSFVTKHTGHASGNPIRFCGGSAYTGDMFTVEPRPKCPLTSTKENRYHGHAVITVYKPNIVSVRRNITRCLQRITHVHAYENIIGTSRDAYRKTKNVFTSPEDCRKWKKTKSACETFRSEDDDQFNMFFSAFMRTTSSHCTFKKHVSQNLAATEYETNPYLDYNYDTSGGDYYSRSATMSEGFVEVSMPSSTMVTPWANIPKELMSKGEYEVNNVTMVWEPFGPDDLCLYVPRFRGEVSYIKYKHGDYNVPINPSDDMEEYTLFLLADQYGAMFNVESSQEVKDLSKLNCMPHKTDYNTKVFQTGTDQIIVVTMTDKGHENKYASSHIPEDMRHRGGEEQIHSAYASVRYDAKQKKVLSTEKDNEVTVTTPSRQGDMEADPLDLEQHYNKVKTTDSKEPPPKHVAPEAPTSTDVLNYINYKRAETQRENLHVRAMQNCFINQIDWDMYTQLLDINPSRAISNRMNMALEASLGGNGFYNVKKCELAIDTTIVPTLRTNSDEIVSVNGKEFSVKQLVHHLGVASDPDKCFAMPLVVFRSGITGTQVVGQVTLEGVINTQKLSYLEACSRNKAHIFMINDHGHFFLDYKREFTDTAVNIMNATEKFLQASLPVEQPAQKGTSLSETQMKQHALSRIHILSIVQPTNLKEKEYSHFPTGLFRNDIYSLAEHQSISLGLMKLMEEQNFERFAAREFNAEFTADRASIDQGFFANVGRGVEGAGDFFLKVEQGNGALLYGLGKGVGAAADGLGRGVGSAEKGLFQGIGDALSSTLMALVLPLVCVVVLAIVGVVIYKQVTGKSDANNPPPYHESMKDR